MWRGLSVSDVINHAAPTLCMKAPMSETKSAMIRSRKFLLPMGRHGLVEAGVSDGSSRDIVPRLYIIVPINGYTGDSKDCLPLPAMAKRNDALTVANKFGEMAR